MTPNKDPKTPKSKMAEFRKVSENANPNCSVSTPAAASKTTKSPLMSSAKSRRPASKVFLRVGPLPMQERKFVVAKRNFKKTESLNVACKCKEKNPGVKKCLCVAYENLRASQEEFFKRKEKVGDGDGEERVKEIEAADEVQSGGVVDNGSSSACSEVVDESEDFELSPHMATSRIRKIRNRLMEEARNSIPEFGSGRVKHLAEAFERLLSIRKYSGDDDQLKANIGLKWELPGLQVKVPHTTELSSLSSSFDPPDFVLSAKELGLGSNVSASFDGSIRSSRATTRTSGRGWRQRRMSSGSSSRSGGSKCHKQHRATIQQPFNLRTEQRGKSKQEEFQKKVEEMLIEAEKQRVPIAQGLPWTTDEPECLVKPPVKESTTPLDIQLHSDVRAMDRAEFDQQVEKKLSLLEQHRLEREREQKLQEEEELRRLRRELVPKAQPMPYFDRPFIPKRSIKLPTIPREPKFLLPQHKKIKCMSLSEMDFLGQHCR